MSNSTATTTTSHKKKSKRSTRLYQGGTPFKILGRRNEFNGFRPGDKNYKGSDNPRWKD
tara:strand:+ start:456 stop:632 length:177 start_codon:yes stop_codon:yes gene_type:complete